MGLVGEDEDDGDLEGLEGLEGPGIGEDGVLFFLALGRHFSGTISWCSRELVRAAPDLEDDKLRFGLFSPLGRSLSDLSSVLPVMREGLGVGRESVLVGFILCIPVRGASGEGVRSLMARMREGETSISSTE